MLISFSQIEKLQNRDYAVPDISEDLRWLKCERGRDKMEGSSGTGQSKQLSSVSFRERERYDALCEAKLIRVNF